MWVGLVYKQVLLWNYQCNFQNEKSLLGTKSLLAISFSI